MSHQIIYYRYLVLIGICICFYLLVSCTNNSKGDQASNDLLQKKSATEEENKDIILRWMDARNTNDLEAGLALWSDNWHDGLGKAFDGITKAFPDIKIIQDDLLTDGKKVVLRWTFEATHQGTYQKIPATGNKVTWKGIDIYTIADGKIVALDRAADWSALMVQLSDDWRPHSEPYYQKFSEK